MTGLAVGFTLRAARHRVAEFAERLRLRVEQDASQENLHDVRPLAEFRRDVEAVGDEHVLRLANLLAVEEVVRERINALEDEEGATDFGNRGLLERFRIEPLAALVGTKCAGVQSFFRFGQDARPHEVKFAVAGHGRGNGLDGKFRRERQNAHRARVGLGEVVELPNAVERERGGEKN